MLGHNVRVVAIRPGRSLVCNQSYLSATPKPVAYDSINEGSKGKERKGKEKGKIRGPHFFRVYVQIAPSLTSPTRVAPRKARTASVYRPSDSKPRIDVLLGIALGCRTRKPNPLLLWVRPP